MKIIITEKQLKNLRLKRRFDVELPNYITSTYKWLNPKAFTNFDEFLDRVVFSTSRDLASDFMDYGNTDDYYSTWDLIKPLVRDSVYQNYYDEILDYYNSHF